MTEQDESHCCWELDTAFRAGNQTPGMTQGVVVEIEGSPRTRLHLQTEGVEVRSDLAELLQSSELVPLMSESGERIRDTFGLGEEDVTNPDAYFHNARKLKIHRAIPESGYRLTRVFRQVRLSPGTNSLYVRVSQLNGQLAWSSPVWIESI